MTADPSQFEPGTAGWLDAVGVTSTPTPPVMPPEQRAIWNAGAEAMREVAAERVQRVRDWDSHDAYCDSCKNGAVYPDAEQIAAEVRALPLPEPPHG